MNFLVPFLLLLFEFGFSHGHTLPRKEILENIDIYKVQDNNHDAITIVNPKSKKPTLREIIYYHVIEKPYEQNQVIVPHKEETVEGPDLDQTRQFTNGHGFQFSNLDSDEDDEDGDAYDEPLDLDVESAGSSDGDHSNEYRSTATDEDLASGHDDTESVGNSYSGDVKSEDNYMSGTNSTVYGFDTTEAVIATTGSDATTDADGVADEIRVARNMLFKQLRDRYHKSLKPASVLLRKKREVEYNDNKESDADYDKKLPEMPEAPVLSELKLDEFPENIRYLISSEKPDTPELRNNNEEAEKELENHTEGVIGEVVRPNREEGDDANNSKEDIQNKPRTYGMKLNNGTGLVWNDLWSNPGMSYDMENSPRPDGEHSENVHEQAEHSIEPYEKDKFLEVKETDQDTSDGIPTENSFLYKNPTEQSKVDITESYNKDSKPVEEENSYGIPTEDSSHNKNPTEQPIVDITESYDKYSKPFEEENSDGLPTETFSHNKNPTEQPTADSTEAYYEVSKPLEAENSDGLPAENSFHNENLTEQTRVDTTEAYDKDRKILEGENSDVFPTENSFFNKNPTEQSMVITELYHKDSKLHEEENSDGLPTENPYFNKNPTEQSTVITEPYHNDSKSLGEENSNGLLTENLYYVKNPTEQSTFGITDAYDKDSKPLNEQNSDELLTEKPSYNKNPTEQTRVDITEAYDKDSKPLQEENVTQKVKILEDIESLLPKRIENILEIIKDQDEDFWVWLQDWSSTYMDLLMKYIKKIVEQEVENQIKLRNHLNHAKPPKEMNTYFVSQKDEKENRKAHTHIKNEGITNEGVKIPVTHNTNFNISEDFNNNKENLINYKSKSGLLKGRRHKKDNKEIIVEINNIESESDKSKPDIRNNTVERSSKQGKIDANNIFGNSYNNDKVTNIYIFYPSNDSKKVIEDLELQKDNNTAFIFEKPEGSETEEKEAITVELETVIDMNDKVTTLSTPTEEAHQATESFNGFEIENSKKSEDKADDDKKDSKELSQSTTDQSTISIEDTARNNLGVVNSMNKDGEDVSERTDTSEIGEIDTTTTL